jgi:arsenate reductase
MPNEARPALRLYGLRNCDSCRRAVKWLQSKGIPHDFHDLRESSPDRALVERWLESPHGHALLNRRSTTWRQLPEGLKALAERDPAALLLQHPTLIKRPVIADGETVISFGFDPAGLEAYR